MLPGSMTSRLSLQGITKRYPGVVANDGVSLEVAPGEIHAVLGENGAGKSTLMKVIYGAVRPDAGEMRWDGQPVIVRSPHEARALGIAMVFQHFSLFDTLTAAENVWLGLDRLEHARRGDRAHSRGRQRVRARRRSRCGPCTRSRWASGSASRSSARCSPPRGS